MRDRPLRWPTASPRAASPCCLHSPSSPNGHAKTCNSTSLSSTRPGYRGLMADWRDTASEDTQADLDRLAQMSISFAESVLDEDGDFLPFPIVIRTNGE